MVLQEFFVSELQVTSIDIVDFFLPNLLLSQAGEFSFQISAFLAQTDDLLFGGYVLFVFHDVLELKATTT